MDHRAEENLVKDFDAATLKAIAFSEDQFQIWFLGKVLI